MNENVQKKDDSLCQIETADFPDGVREVYLVPPHPVIVKGDQILGCVKIHPLSWWRRWCRPYWFFKHRCDCCCCFCCKDQSGRALPPPPPPVTAPLTINLFQGMLPIGSAFYLLITHRGSVCQFVLEWFASGGNGQLTVDLDVQDPGSATFRRLATGLGPTDQYTFNGLRGATYVFRATVTDAQGQTAFDTHTVTCP